MTDDLSELRREIAELRREVGELRRELAAARQPQVVPIPMPTCPPAPFDPWRWPVIYSSTEGTQ